MLYIVSKQIVAAALALSCCGAHAAVLECPINAPADWKVPKARLDRARVLSYLSATRSDERGLAEGLPDSEWQIGGTLFQSWNIKAGRRGMVYRVNCLYTGTARFIRFDAHSTARCLAKRRVRGDALIPGSMEFQCR